MHKERPHPMLHGQLSHESKTAMKEMEGEHKKTKKKKKLLKKKKKSHSKEM